MMRRGREANDEHTKTRITAAGDSEGGDVDARAHMHSHTERQADKSLTLASELHYSRRSSSSSCRDRERDLT